MALIIPATVSNPKSADDKPVLQGEALKHDRSWLFYVEVTVSDKPATAPTVPELEVLHTYAMLEQCGERERQALLPLQVEYEHTYKTNLMRTA